MAKNYREVSYFQTRPDVVKIFEDLERYLDFCRINLYPFNEADLYNNKSPIYREFEGIKKPRRDFDRKDFRSKNKTRQWFIL